MSDWLNCVVTLIDVIGIRSLVGSGDSAATTRMRKLHSVVAAAAGHELPAHSRAYCWNDSVLLLGNLDAHGAQTLLSEADALKSVIERDVGNAYAIAVKGQAFPTMQINQADDRVVVIEASSFALANCFAIEECLKKHKAAWYVDSRFRREMSRRPEGEARVKLLPSGSRSILMFRGKLYEK